MGRSAVGRPRGVRRFILRNGLTVLLAPIPRSPTVSVWVWYRVGSKNEWPGVTGASHWVEHMLFQGSPRYAKGEIDRAVVAAGGNLNAFTDYDFTAYFTTVPAGRLGIPLDIEADRMTRARIAPAEVERERTVIRSEREGNENWPEFRVEEELYELAFRHHPYRWDALGRKADIERMGGRELREYYRRFYGPKNAVLVVAGGFDPRATGRKIRAAFGRLPGLGADPAVRVTEPMPRGERRSELTGPGTTPYLQLGFRAPSVYEPAAPATMMVDSVLGGETRLFSAGSALGRGRDHPSSRLYRGLVDTGLAVRASSDWRPRVHPGLFTVQAQAAEGVSLDRLETATLRLLEQLAARGPTRRELDDARVRIRRSVALAYEGASHTGFRLGYFATLRHIALEDDLYAGALRVTPEEVRARAAELFASEHRAVVRYTPIPEANDGG